MIRYEGTPTRNIFRAADYIRRIFPLDCFAGQLAIQVIVDHYFCLQAHLNRIEDTGRGVDELQRLLGFAKRHGKTRTLIR
jgi:hypothetical protein